METKRARVTAGDSLANAKHGSTELILQMQKEGKDFVILMQMVAQCVGGSADEHRKHIESAAHFVTMCSEPSLLRKDRELLDLFMVLYMIANRHPQTVDARLRRLQEYKDGIRAMRTGCVSLQSSSSIVTVCLMVRQGLILADYDSTVVDTIADVTAKLFASFTKELESEPPKTIDAYIMNRRESVAVPWWINLQLAMLRHGALDESIIHAASDSVWLINDAVSLARDKQTGSTNLLINFLPDDCKAFVSLFNQSLAILDDGLSVLVADNKSLEAEVVFASVMGNSAVYALMERYHGWRYQWTTDLQLQMRDLSRTMCLSWTDKVCKHLRDQLHSWGIVNSNLLLSQMPVSMLMPSLITLRDPSMTAWIKHDAVLSRPSPEAGIQITMIQAEIEWWIGQCGLGEVSPARMHLPEPRAMLEVRSLALWAVLEPQKNDYAEMLMPWFVKLINVPENIVSFAEAYTLCDIWRALLRTEVSITDIDQAKACSKLVPLLKDSNSSSMALNASIARLLATFPSAQLGDLRSGLMAALQAQQDVRFGLGAVHETIERAIAKSVLGMDFQKEVLALQGHLISSRISLEPIVGLSLSPSELITSSSLTTVMAFAVVKAFHLGKLF